MKFPCLILGLLVSFTPLLSAKADGDSAAVDKLMGRVEQATKALHSFRAEFYEEIQRARPSGAAPASNHQDKIKLSFLRPNLFTAESSDPSQPARATTYISDGKLAYPQTGGAARSPMKVGPDALGFGIWHNFTQVHFMISGSLAKVMEEAPVTPTKRMLPDETWNGDTYQVAEFHVAGGYPITYKYYIGKDLLVHRIIETDDDNGHPFSLDTYMTHFEANPALAASDFAVKAPEAVARSGEERERAPATGSPGAMAANFSLPTPTGERMALSDALKGKKAVLVNFWFVHCPPCRAEHPKLEAFYNELKGKGLGVLAIDDQDTPENVAKYMKGAGLTFPTVLDGKRSEPDYKTLDPYGVHSCPTNFIIDSTGKIVYRGSGWNEAALRKVLADLGVS